MDVFVSPRVLLGLAGWVAAGVCWAQAAQAPAPAPARMMPLVEPAKSPEPFVEHIVVEDDGSRIEELRVRGETQRIKVQPKGVNPRLGYEIVTPSGGRDMTPNFTPGRGAAGQRVWSLLSF